ncbi:MAG: hypothetical protein HKN47_16310 [Pirellulaceae bacterium]|nr:hypothetical protein [Pirellulaceae bacterium]
MNSSAVVTRKDYLMNFVSLAVTVLLVTGLIQPGGSGSIANAQTDSANRNQDDAEDRESIGDWREMEDRFRELIIAEAVRFDSDVQLQAIEIVKQRKLQSPKFDDAIRRAMTINDESTDIWPNVRNAMTLKPFSTITQSDWIELCLNVLAREQSRYRQLSANYSTAVAINLFKNARGGDSKERVPTELIIDQLSKSPKILAQQLQERLDDADRSALMCAVAALTDAEGAGLVTPLMEAAKSKDAVIKKTAIASLNHILVQLEKNRVVSSIPDAVALTETNSKLVRYAAKIVSRYDTNDDRVLTEDEWDKMLMNPLKADANGDDKISINEYAQWMESRSK